MLRVVILSTLAPIATSALTTLTPPAQLSRRAALGIMAASPVSAQDQLLVGIGLPMNSQLQQSVLQEHAARFDSSSSPAAIASIAYGGQQMRSLIATVNLPPNTRVAAYPVEVVSDEDDHDDIYAVSIFREMPRSSSTTRPATRVEFDDVSGVPTRTSLAKTYIDGLPTIAMVRQRWPRPVGYLWLMWPCLLPMLLAKPRD